MENTKEDYFEIGRQFAYEGLDESYLKGATQEELEEFRNGFLEVQKGLKNSSPRYEDSVENESRSMHR